MESYIEFRGCFASIRIGEGVTRAFVKIRFDADCRCCEHWNFRGMQTRGRDMLKHKYFGKDAGHLTTLKVWLT